MPVPVTFYYCSAPVNKINKLPNLQKIPGMSDMMGELVNDYNEEAPMLRFQDLNSDSNYAEIAGKYYFIVNKTSPVNGIWDMQFQYDYLMNEQDYINNLKVYVERSSDPSNNPYISDPQNILTSKKIIKTATGKSFKMDEEDGCYILATSNDGTNYVDNV